MRQKVHIMFLTRFDTVVLCGEEDGMPVAAKVLDKKSQLSIETPNDNLRTFLSLFNHANSLKQPESGGQNW